MSSGRFVNAAYKASTFPNDQVLPIRVQVETLALSWTDPTDGSTVITNESITDSVTLPIRATVSKNRRQTGVHARYVYIKLDNAAELPDYISDSVIKLPILDPADWQTILTGVTKCAYLGAAWTFIGKEPERIV